MIKFGQINQKGIVFVPVLIGIVITITGIAMVSEATGHHISLLNSPTFEQSNQPLPTQGQVQAPPVSSSTSPNFNYEGAKAAGYSDTEIQDYLASKAQNKNSVTPKPQATKASDKALRLSAYIFAASNENQRDDLINKFSNGKNDLKLAVTNLALLLDSRPEVLASAEMLIAQDITGRSAKTLPDNNDQILEYHQKELERIKNQNESLGVYSQDSDYISKVQDANPYINNISKSLPPSAPIVNTTKETIRYNSIGDTIYGSDGSRYNKIGDTIYRNDGTRYNMIGDTLYGSDGTRYNQIGDTLYKNDGTRYNTIGDTVYGSDGSRATSIGDTLYTWPGR